RIKNMWTSKNSIIGAFLLLSVTACSTTKTVSTAGGSAKELSKKDKRSLVDAVSANALQYETFNTKAKTKLSVDNKSFSSTLNIRIKNNETIWISATAFLGIRSEEHTSELQSRENLVCRLLLEKKKN